MAEAGPSSAAVRHVHSHPSDEQQDQDAPSSQVHNTRTERVASMTSLGIGHPSSSTRRLTSGSRVSSQESSGSKRRVWSVDEAASQPGPSRLRHAHDLEIEQYKRASTAPKRVTSRRRENIPVPVPGDVSAAPFSDEYDLSHEDPRILEDVQRAVQLKARREARLKALQGKTQSLEASFASDHDTLSSYSTNVSPVRAKLPELPTSTVPITISGSLESEVDFSPSVGSMPSHPVPSSSDGGATLDWTGSSSEDERDKRWPLSRSRRKGKDKYGAGGKAVVEKQESVYTEKLAQIKARIKPHTLRKAAITGEQLQRRYAVLLDSSHPNINTLAAARWYSKQDQVVRTALDHAQPLTWLKHLLEKRGASARLPWHVTAVTLEEYAKTIYPPLQSIPEESVVDGPLPVTSPQGHSATSSGSKSTSKSPSSRSWSLVLGGQPLEPSLSRKRAETIDDIVSFEPQIDSGRSSAGGDSRRSSFDLVHNRRGSLVHGMSESAGSSLRNSALNNYGMSPSSSRINFRDIATRMRRKPIEKGEEALSSARNSISEQSQEEPSPLKGRRRTRPSSIQSPRVDGVTSEADDDRLVINLGPSSGDGPLTARQDQATFHSAEPTVTGQTSRVISTGPHTPSFSAATAQRANRLRVRRMSLPSLNQMLLQEHEKRQIQASEEQERLEYDRKTRMLEETLEQNRRTRQLLQRVSVNVREYENVRSHLSALLGTPYTSVPKEVLDAFSHDPASITGSTRRLEMYQVVEYIHERIVLQRETLLSFALSLKDEEDGDPTGRTVFEDKITALADALEQLEHHRKNLATEAEQVIQALAEVKEVHTGVKREYNEVLAHTSLIYPELSQIVALEENYRNRYQQIWDIGMDALTLLLDTVTPVWRNYGKIIGEDVQDFLIIPWYRNEFTGEPRRYPIKHLPKRSFRHWVGLLLFYLITICIMLLQISAAVSSTRHYNLPWITHTGFRWLILPFFTMAIFVQWVAALVECCIVFAEFGLIVWWLGWAVRIFH